MKRFSTWLASAIGLTGPLPAHAADITAAKLQKGGTAIFVVGDIRAGDGAKFRSEASRYDDAFVLLESDGGALAEAIDIGETIRLKGYATAVINGSSCNSACALVWLAGAPRALSRSGKLGFHAAYSDRSGTTQESGVANAMVGRYLTLLNLPAKAIVFATSSPPSRLNWLTAANYASTGIDLKVIDDIDVAKGPGSAKARSAEPPPLVRMAPSGPAGVKKETSVWRKLDPWTVFIDHTLADGCFLLSGFERGTYFRVGVDRAAGGYYIVFGNEAWESLKTGQKYDVQFQFDGHSPWDVPTTGVLMGSAVFLTAGFDDSNFWKEFSNSEKLAITRNGKSVTTLTLSNAQLAFNELVKCQKYEDANRRPRDPFAE